MLSKQQKLRYGQILRQQMKQKEDKKKMDDMQKRGSYRQPQMLPIREQPVYMSPQVQRKDNVYMRPPSYIDSKEELQKKLESQDYNPFGGLGGGAPNRRVEQNPQNMRNMSQPSQVRMGAEQMMYQPNPYNNQPPQRGRNITQQNDNYPPQYHPNQMQSISPQSMGYPPRQAENMFYQEGSYQQIPQQGRMINNPYQQQPILQSNRQYPQYNNNNYGNNREGPQKQQPSFDILLQNQHSSNQMIQQQQSYLPSSNQYPPMSQSIPIQQQSPPMEQQQSYNQPSNENVNQELQEVYKRGGRNLLKLQNETIDEQLMKQRRKQQIQKQLKLQIQEAQKRKKDEKQKLKQAQQEQERRHLQYLAEQKRRVDEEQRKKREEKQRIIDDNVKNLQLKKKMQEEAKRKVQQERLEKQRKSRQFQKQKDDEIQRQQQIQRKKTIAIQVQESLNDDSASVVSSNTSQLEKDFNTALSKEFFRKQREKNNNPSSSYQNKKLEQFSNQIQQINRQMAHQRQLMERQIELMRNQAQRAKTDKKKAEQEIQQLKRELKKKMDEENDKLLRALQGNDFRIDNYNQLPPQNYKNLNQPQSNQYPPFAKKPMKQRQNENLVRKQFEVKKRKFIPHQEQLSQFQQSHVGEMVSLDGDSKKIPVYLEHSDKLTMSQVQNFAKDSSFFQKGSSNNVNKNSPMKKQKFNMKISESIAEQPEEEREYMNNQSRKSNRYKQQKKQSTLFRQEKDELDRLIDSRAKSRRGWDEMSSVNEDITKEIEQLLRKKENPIGGGNNGRPSSISNAGRQTLAKQGFAYDGLTLNSHVSHVGGTLNTNGTVDLQRINGRNDARLRQLRNLGVQTVNTNGDDDLNALDQLLNKYK